MILIKLIWDIFEVKTFQINVGVHTEMVDNIDISSDMLC